MIKKKENHVRSAVEKCLNSNVGFAVTKKF